ncbi:hypothetical protein AAM37_gp71 [Pantoea phage vB_PagM_AAM37]|uniref:Uncharacterized protein n=1 Tax=Pantoea phage vB_PagM_AAM37 TaxID=2588093 RepID=A0A513ZYK4_9CAUD|nr:hypothetical protein HWC22_gp71 [Pantoea phage vB_PagM_AAM37]QDH45742.1 hypothetical protein AAM37_gp71 [Pantoea phage vB_PagM_AAM37]
MSQVRSIGRAGKHRQHLVYSVTYDGKVYTVTPGLREATRIIEIRGYKGKMSRQVQRVTGLLLDHVISLAIRHERGEI